VGAHGACVRTASDGPRSLEMVESWIPDVLLIDIGLPRMDGYQLMEALRRRPGLQGALAVAVTGYGCNDVLVRHAGFDDCVRKPFDGEALVDLVLRLRREKTK
jgi:CheY-like chemotaxis protein